MASPHWEKLSKNEKEEYKNGAQNTEPIPYTNRKIKNCLGQDIDEIEAKRRKEKNEYESLKEEIKLLLDNANDVGGDYETT